MLTELQIWKWTLTKEAIAPCFVRDALEMHQSSGTNADFFWLGYTPCRTVLLVGMVVAIQVYDKRAIYTIDDGTAVIDCVYRYPPPPPVPSKTKDTGTKNYPQRSPTKKARLANATLESMELPPPITEPGYPVRVVGKVVPHYQSKQIHADSIDPCSSSLDEIVHLECVIELHKTKYSLAVPFQVPHKASPSHSTSTPHTSVDADGCVFSDPSLSSRPGNTTTSYSLPAPPSIPMPLQNRNGPPSRATHVNSTFKGHTHVPSSPTASSIASSTPSSPCKPSSPDKQHETSDKPRLRHPSRLHTRDLTANTFRLYVKHYMDNAPPPFSITCTSPTRSTCGGFKTPTKHARDEDESDKPTPRPRLRTDAGEARITDGEESPMLGFTLSHLRRVPELALLASRVVRAETRKRDKTEREKEKERAHLRIASGGTDKNGKGSVSAGTKSTIEPLRKKIKRLFSWAVVKLYEEGSIVLWDGDVRPLPVPPPAGSIPLIGLWNNDTNTQGRTLDWSSASCRTPSSVGNTSASVLYASSASASLYSHYHAPRPQGKGGREEEGDVDMVDPDADPTYLSDPSFDEESYVPLTVQFLAGYARDAANALRRGNASRGRGRGRVGATRGAGVNGEAREPTAEDVLGYMQRVDARWARVGVWAVEEALATGG